MLSNSQGSISGRDRVNHGNHGTSTNINAAKLLLGFKDALMGTRFDKNGTINGSANAAVRELMISVIEEKKKVKGDQQIPNSGILQPRNEYTTKTLNDFLDCSDEHLAECIEHLPRG